VPSETAVITAGVVAGGGDLSLPLVVIAGAGGAFAGDNISYFIGQEFGRGVVDRFFGGEKGRGRIEWAKRRLRERGVQLILVGRFIPGGRTAVTLTAGLTRFGWRRFLPADAAAALAWGIYAALLGYFGGRAFEDEPWQGLVIALGIGFALGGAVEAGRHLRRRFC
jgi:membrane protein DedA with SNARE-associated domain